MLQRMRLSKGKEDEEGVKRKMLVLEGCNNWCPTWISVGAINDSGVCT